MKEISFQCYFHNTYLFWFHPEYFSMQYPPEDLSSSGFILIHCLTMIIQSV
jgi:hypothetical protein